MPGLFPAAAMVRIWRELMAASVGMQGTFTLAVCVPEGMSGYIQLTRRPVRNGRSTRHLQHAGRGDQRGGEPALFGRYRAGACAGRTPIPGGACWSAMTEAGCRRVIGRLPFTGMAGGASDELVWHGAGVLRR